MIQYKILQKKCGVLLWLGWNNQSGNLGMVHKIIANTPKHSSENTINKTYQENSHNIITF